ncbi:PAC2 family-domain-containing protein [Chytridium lagenaria]|nr:PAC2 family-domain-containing protein [Chytridium lagenaria]
MLQFHPTTSFATDTLKASKVILPSPNNIGNLGQLAVDVLLCSLGPVKVGTFTSPLVYAVAGGGAYQAGSSEQLTTSFELFQVNGRNIFIVQLRTPALKGQGSNFAKAFAEWAKNAGVAEVLVVSGADASRRTDSQLGDASPIRVKTDEGTLGAKAQSLGLAGIEKFIPSYEEQAQESAKATFPFPPGMGLARLLLNSLKDSELKSTYVTIFVNEGDNTNASVFLAQHISALLDLKIDAFNIPYAWKNMYTDRDTLTTIYQ